MKRSVLSLIALTIFVISAPVFAATQTANLPISATVIINCTISTAPVAFGNYDPVGANGTVAQPLDATGSVIVACTKGASGLRIDLNNGLNGAVAPAMGTTTTRTMNNGANYLDYELFSNAARTTVWGSGAVNGLAIANAPSKAARTFTVYGRVPGGQDASALAFADTVVATINY